MCTFLTRPWGANVQTYGPQCENIVTDCFSQRHRSCMIRHCQATYEQIILQCSIYDKLILHTYSFDCNIHISAKFGTNVTRYFL